MAFVRVRATMIAVQVNKRFPWSKPESVEVKREGFLTLNLALCTDIFALAPNQYGVPLEITTVEVSKHSPVRWIPHITPHDYIELVRSLGLFGLVDLVKPEQTIIYT